jgi:hypothetical protein
MTGTGSQRTLDVYTPSKEIPMMLKPPRSVDVVCDAVSVNVRAAALRGGMLTRIRAALLASFTILALACAPSIASAGLTVFPADDPSGKGLDITLSTAQAGAHPDFSISFNLTPLPSLEELISSNATLKTTVTDTPPGLVGNPEAVGKCRYSQILPSTAGVDDCPLDSQVGFVEIRIGFVEVEPFTVVVVPLYAMDTPPNRLATLAFKVEGSVIVLDVTVRPDDQGLRVTARNNPQNQFAPVSGITLHVWGVPGDPSHDLQRCENLNRDTPEHLCDGNKPPTPNPGIPRKAFFTNPTVCEPQQSSSIQVSSWWQEPAGVLSDPVVDTDPGFTGCNQLDFSPTIEAKATTTLADSPSGLDFKLHLPQNTDPDGLAEAHLKDTVVTFPKGFTVNPSSANGLGACSLAQVGLETDSLVQCPDSSKLGTVEVNTPVLANPLHGELYLAEQGKNPFNSLIALYLVAKGPGGLLIKTPGKVETDPATGQLTTVFNEVPQVPFEDLSVNLFTGARGALKTPSTCGTFTTTSQMTPWTSPEGADAFPADSFQITQGPGGGACIASEDKAPNSPAFNAGTVDPTAGAYSPFVLKLARADGSQEIKAIDTTLPPGLVGKLAGTTYCPEAALSAAQTKSGAEEQASPSCPLSSEVGTINVAAGAGPAPYNAQGTAYLAGPYKGAPLSLAIITPAVAGPFDLGVVVVRAALDLDPESFQIKATSDPIPTILQGIPLEIRTISLNVDRPSFTLNPTSCDPMAITGQSISVFDQAASLSNRFQVGECARLGFKPKLAIKLKGGTKRGQNPALTATLTYPKGAYANIASASVALPRSEFLDNSHIGTVCTRVQYAANQCPPKSVYGFARATSPLLEGALEGPVYLRSSSNELPDLVMGLRGQIDVDVVGRIDSTKGGGLRTTFDRVPDAPVSKFTLKMKGGKKGLLENSENLCLSDNKATARFIGQNGKVSEQRPVVKPTGCKGKARKPGKRR